MRAGVCICRIIFLTGASNNHNDSFPFFLSLFLCALHRFRRARSALSCYPPWFVPFPLPSFFPALSILSALGGIGWRGCVLLSRGGGGAPQICTIASQYKSASAPCKNFLWCLVFSMLFGPSDAPPPSWGGGDCKGGGIAGGGGGGSGVPVHEQLLSAVGPFLDNPKTAVTQANHQPPLHEHARIHQEAKQQNPPMEQLQ